MNYTEQQQIELRIQFPSKKVMEVFATWLSDGGGEQDFFDAAESEGLGRFRLRYHPENPAFPRDDRRRYGKFIEDRTIKVESIEPEIP